MDVPAPTLTKCRLVTGNSLRFRDAAVEDAGFILALRMDAEKGQYLSPTSPDLEKQVAWLKGYADSHSQVYFIIETLDGNRIGTVRLYDPQGRSFSWGSWILTPQAGPHHAMESALMVYAYALGLGFEASHFEVRVANRTVWRFHEMFGAVRVRETEEDYFFMLGGAQIADAMRRFGKYLPDGIALEA